MNENAVKDQECPTCRDQSINGMDELLAVFPDHADTTLVKT